jgi:cyclic pyranopterin phosphate synthase
LKDVIASIDIVRDVGLTPVKVNAVIMRGVNDDEVAAFAQFAKDHEIDMRLIEFMALDAAKKWNRNAVVSAKEMLQSIQRKHVLIRENDPRASTSMNFRFENGNGRIGIIASVTESFCGACNRMRIMADGKVRPCLFSDDEWDIRPLFRDGASDDDLRQFFVDAMWQKSAGHNMSDTNFQRPEKTMSRIGG